MKIALFGSNRLQFSRVFTSEVLDALSQRYDITQRIGHDDLEKNAAVLKETEIAFGTWGMPVFTPEEIKQYMPNLKALFYAAGTVQYFAKPFLDCGVRIFGSASINAVPVVEYTFSQIVLANKGYFQAAKNYKLAPVYSLLFADHSSGNYQSKVGLVGLGAIGSAVALRLKTLDVQVFAYDPFVSPEKAAALGVTLTDLDTLFSECDIISNHLANKKELENIYTRKLFSKMKKHSTFINTGRGAQVKELDLALSLLLHPSRTALIDVLKKDLFPYGSPLFWCRNAIITPHIAGSMGNEPQRMAYYMMETMEKYLNNEPVESEITEEMLATMA
ncbi:MAG: hydroxyacid dehydrogenase [Clostridiales bacterium]|nr:hydroxyacid dehydrogenase [Clostridiales bacterium]